MLFLKPRQSIRDFALAVEDLLTGFITVSSVGMAGAQRTALAAQALEVFVDKLRDWVKARYFETLK